MVPNLVDFSTVPSKSQLIQYASRNQLRAPARSLQTSVSTIVGFVQTKTLSTTYTSLTRFRRASDGEVHYIFNGLVG